MTRYYVKHTGSDTAPYDTWAKAATTLATVTAIAVSGDTIEVSSDHVEDTDGAVSFAIGSIAANNPVIIRSVDDSAEPPTVVEFGASIRTTGAQAITLNGNVHWYGIHFLINSSGNASNASFAMASLESRLLIENCLFENNSNNAGAGMNIGVNGTATSIFMTWIDTWIKFRVSGQAIRPTGLLQFDWIGGGVDSSGANPANLLTSTAARYNSRYRFTGLDLSHMTGTSRITNLPFTSFTVTNCKLGNSNPMWAEGSNVLMPGNLIVIDNCDDADTNYRMERYSYSGSVITETTVLLDDGATNGTTPHSFLMTTTANSSYYLPLESPKIAVWIDSTGSKTFTLEILHDSTTNLKNDEVWLELEYTGVSGFPQTNIARNRTASQLVVSSDLPAGTGVGNWTTTGLSDPNSQKLELIVTVEEVGWAFLTVAIAKASYSVYVDPKVVIT